MDWEVIAIILFSGAAVFGIVYLLSQYRSLRDFDWIWMIPSPDGQFRYSHSMVAGGLPEMSYTTREIPGTSLITRCATRSRNS